MAMAFLITRVKNPDEDDWGKLKQVLKYPNGTKFLKLTLTVENLGMLKWYVGGAHSVHWDCKGHGGAVFKLDKGATNSYSRKVKLNTRSSTETEFTRPTCSCRKCCGCCILYKHKDMRPSV
jgi:hypothetical protein